MEKPKKKAKPAAKLFELRTNNTSEVKLPLNKHSSLLLLNPHAADGLAIKMRRAARSISFMFMLNKKKFSGFTRLNFN